MRTACSTLLLSVLLAGPAAWAVDSAPPAGAAVPDLLLSARAAIEVGDWRKALGDLRQAQRSEPRNADVHNLLGYTYRKQAKPDLAKAFEHYRTALRLDPKHRGAHEYIGEAYLMIDDLAGAERHLAVLRSLCLVPCDELKDLEKDIAEYKAIKAVRRP